METKALSSSPGRSFWKNLIRRAAALAEPEGYFTGQVGPAAVLPRNILAFHRTHLLTPQGGDDLHSRYVLICAMRGPGKAVINDLVINLPQGHFFLIFPSQFHHFLLSMKTIDWLIITFELPESAWLEPLRNRHLPATSLTREMLLQVVESYSGDATDRRAHLLTHSLAYLLALLVRKVATLPDEHAGAEAMDRTITAMQKVNQTIFARISEPLRISELAREAGLSGSHLRLLFRKQTGLGLGHYIQRIRINTARHLLEESQLPVKQIAFNCGFKSSQSFARAFRQAHGVSPHGFRKTCQSAR